MVRVTRKEKIKRQIKWINRFTELDVYPLPNISQMHRKIAEYPVYNAFDLQSPFHQIPNREVEKSLQHLKLRDNYLRSQIEYPVSNGLLKR